ncbi:MAG TPA: TonB-dependent receptor, partial [Candidatus Binatia bacterium]|nr:TonB-dependent receptor [Candidatus Binatia bacterium]
SQTEKIIFERQQAGSLVDAVGSEQFSRLGAGDAGQIVSRVTGVSVVGGKYVVVRGLSDRYTRTLLNGVEVPSADPYKLSPQLDLFPSAMIDSVSVSKTFAPDQPGGTGGGMIDIVTKSFPEKPFAKVSFGTSYNPNSNLKNDFLADPGSRMQMLAFPSQPAMIGSDLFGLTEAPNRPGPSSSGETINRANTRRQQANEVAGLLQELGTANFAGAERGSPLNSSFVASAGDTTPLFGHNLGVFGGLNYRREFKALDEAIVNRYSPEGRPTRLGMEQRGNIDTDYGANANLGYQLWEGSEVGFNFMLAHSTDEEARRETSSFVEGREDSLERWQLHYTDRQILNYQLNGHHVFPFLLDSKLNWVVALANTTQKEPDQRFMNYFLSPAGQPQFGDAATPFPQFPSRYFRDINEDGFNYRVDWTLPLAFISDDSKFKTGYFSSSNSRDFREQFFSYNFPQGFDPNNPNTYLNNPAYLQYIATHVGNVGNVGRTNFSFLREIADTFSHPYTASLDVNAVYAMADVEALSWLRVIGGARLESTLLDLDAHRDGTARIDQTDLLPAASLVVSLRTNTDLRLSYGETVSRPSYRELAPIQSYLPDLGVTALGNTDLEMVSIRSYDLRLEWFPGPGDVISAGIFYKELERPIELISRTAGDEQVTWENRTNGLSKLMGVEFEARKSMEFLWSGLRGLSLAANVTLIKSSTRLSDTEVTNKRRVDPSADTSRPLYDQSPYIINADLTYDHPTWGTSLTVGANLTGERIVLAKTIGPDIYEHPPISLDAAISQRFWKHWTLRFGVRNILDYEYRYTYGRDYSGNIFQSYKRGRTYGLTVSAEF